jgi:hypothetical protein
MKAVIEQPRFTTDPAAMSRDLQLMLPNPRARAPRSRAERDAIARGLVEIRAFAYDDLEFRYRRETIDILAEADRINVPASDVKAHASGIIRERLQNATGEQRERLRALERAVGAVDLAGLYKQIVRLAHRQWEAAFAVEAVPAA